MKVLQLNAVAGVRSTGTVVTELAQGLSERGIESRVASSVGSRAQTDYLVGDPVEKKLHALASRLSGKQGYFSTRGTKRLIEYIAHEAPDIVHLHNLHANFVNLPLLLEYLAEWDIATVVTLHDCWFFTGKCCHYTAEGCYRWLDGCGSCPRLRKDNPSWLLDKTSEMWLDKKRLFEAIPRLAVIGVSDWILGEAQQSFLACAAIIRRIYNWVDMDVFRPTYGAAEDSAPASRSFVVASMASQWSDGKGLSDLLRLGHMIDDGVLSAVTSTASSRAVAQVEVQLVGHLSGRRELPRSVCARGSLHEAGDVAAFLAGADVFLQLSREETFGKVTAEALASGTPVIAYDCTANPELIGPGCGHVVPVGDLSAVSESIRNIASSERPRYQTACRAYATAHFAMADRIDDHVTLYEDLVALRRGR